MAHSGRCDVCGDVLTDESITPYPCGTFRMCWRCSVDFSVEELAEAENLILLMGQAPTDEFGNDPRELLIRMLRLARAGAPKKRANESHAAA